jgi:hypothetical protein
MAADQPWVCSISYENAKEDVADAAEFQPQEHRGELVDLCERGAGGGVTGKAGATAGVADLGVAREKRLQQRMELGQLQDQRHADEQVAHDREDGADVQHRFYAVSAGGGRARRFYSHPP